MITFTVYGLPKTKGSMKAFRHKSSGKTIVTSDTPGLRAWEHMVGFAAQREARGRMLLGPITVCVTFYLPKPKRPKALMPIMRPDLDKLIRGSLDGLTGVLFHDDAQVVQISAAKHYAREDETPRAEFRIQGVPDDTRRSDPAREGVSRGAGTETSV